ncbi:GGDEF domain-containing protein [Thalassotalea piscium]|uniref:GGDEF domain-containing protein n=1 Tax=Thalassotalea piscium TaxID=1230533 RepID=UPI00361BB988
MNDLHGHKVGDRILCHLSELISVNIRDVDLLARWGGDEFVIILPELDLEQAKLACEKLKSLINSNPISCDLSVTCSFGVAQYHLGDTLNELFVRVDKLLYSAKQQGRNTVQT